MAGFHHAAVTSQRRRVSGSDASLTLDWVEQTDWANWLISFLVSLRTRRAAVDIVLVGTEKLRAMQEKKE